MVWTTDEFDESGQRVSLLHRKTDAHPAEIVSSEPTGHNTEVSISDDGKTLVWLWKHPRYLHPNEIRKAQF